MRCQVSKSVSEDLTISFCPFMRLSACISSPRSISFIANRISFRANKSSLLVSSRPCLAKKSDLSKLPTCRYISLSCPLNRDNRCSRYLSFRAFSCESSSSIFCSASGADSRIAKLPHNRLYSNCNFRLASAFARNSSPRLSQARISSAGLFCI